MLLPHISRCPKKRGVSPFWRFRRQHDEQETVVGDGSRGRDAPGRLQRAGDRDGGIGSGVVTGQVSMAASLPGARPAGVRLSVAGTGGGSG